MNSKIACYPTEVPPLPPRPQSNTKIILLLVGVGFVIALTLAMLLVGTLWFLRKKSDDDSEKAERR